jgi:tripartite-type tricarboxylate transporter receptor subunit TctC
MNRTTQGRRVLRACIAAWFSICATGAQAQAYPAKPVRVIVPFGAGGATDTMARVMAARWQEVFGQRFLVENRTGANGNIGAEYVARSPADGYTLMVLDLGSFTSGPAVAPNLPFDPATDFTPITLLIGSPYGLAVTPSLPVKNVPELLAWARANPGKFNYATLGEGSTSHLAGLELAARAGTSFAFVPYKGGAQVLTDVAAGQAQALGLAMLSTLPFVQGGKLKLIAVMSRERMGILPEVPTVAESGHAGFVAGQWQAVYAPKGLAPEIAERIRAESARFLTAPETRKRFADQGAEVMPGSAENLARFVAEERAKFTRLVKEHNIKVE